MKFKNFEKSAKVLVGLALVNALTGCGSSIVAEGNYGLAKTFFTGTYDRTPSGKGFTLGLISGIHEVFGREELLKIDDITPRDKNGISLKHMDLVVTYRSNRDKAVEYIVQTSDVEEVNGVMHLGRQRVERDGRNTIGRTVEKFESITIFNNPIAVEEQFKIDLQNDLDKNYGKGTLIVESVKISNVRVADVVEAKIQNIAVIDAENARNEATKKILANRESTLLQEAAVLTNVAAKSGLTVDQLLRYEAIKAIKEGSPAQLQVSADSKHVTESKSAKP